MNPVWNQPLTADSSMKVLITWNLKTEKTNSVFFFLVKTVLKYQKKKKIQQTFFSSQKRNSHNPVKIHQFCFCKVLQDVVYWSKKQFQLPRLTFIKWIDMDIFRITFFFFPVLLKHQRRACDRKKSTWSDSW